MLAESYLLAGLSSVISHQYTWPCVASTVSVLGAGHDSKTGFKLPAEHTVLTLASLCSQSARNLRLGVRAGSSKK